MKIFAPNKLYSGISSGVTFVSGQGEVDEKKKDLVEWFKSKGYVVGEKPSDITDPDPKPVVTKESLEALKRDELVALAAKYEIEKPNTVKTVELVAAILKIKEKK